MLRTYPFNWMDGRSQAQFLPDICSGEIQLGGAPDIIYILENTCASPNPIGTAQSTLDGLNQGKCDTAGYFSQIQIPASMPNWDARADLGALREGYLVGRRRMLVTRKEHPNCDQLVGVLQATRRGKVGTAAPRRKTGPPATGRVRQSNVQRECDSGDPHHGHTGEGQTGEQMAVWAATHNMSIGVVRGDEIT